ncbi:RING-H2 finger protein ATL8-like [Arachis stenosperma]|uniref:RING-H2 finger protein ATL8-like n=1 Tax=Arachis stenosperma TaxID=217475 RepID=UPI0025ACCBE7|nr:RING-H2 finger protein ATL8-like [Arachis stenosperma]
MTRMLRILQSATANNATTTTAIAAAVPPAEAASVESDFVVILAALLCALICVVGLIAVARCAWLRRVPVAGTGASPHQALANRGLKKKVLNSLPKFTYVDGDAAGAGNGADAGVRRKWTASSECSICLAEFAAGDEVRVLPQCGHGFHVACIDTWLGSHSSCPSCRAVLAVGRCQKCGQFPAVPNGATVVAIAGETELKSVVSNSNGNAGSNSRHASNDFLP